MTCVLVTGANRGIGLEFTRQLLARGDQVIATCREPAKAGALAGLAGGDGRLDVLQLDLGDEASLAGFAQRLGDRPVDVLVNNAGVYGPRAARFGGIKGEDWYPVLQVNTVAPLLLTQMLMGNLRGGRDRKLVYITSMMGSVADNRSGGSYIYRSSKAALNQVVKSLSVDLAAEGFTAAVIHPGWVQTDMGGPNALIDTRTSVSGMLQVIDRLGKADAGRFFNYDGGTIAW